MFVYFWWSTKCLFCLFTKETTKKIHNKSFVKRKKDLCKLKFLKGSVGWHVSKVCQRCVRASPEWQQPIENRMKCVIQARSELFSAWVELYSKQQLHQRGLKYQVHWRKGTHPIALGVFVEKTLFVKGAVMSDNREDFGKDIQIKWSFPGIEKRPSVMPPVWLCIIFVWICSEGVKHTGLRPESSSYRVDFSPLDGLAKWDPVLDLWFTSLELWDTYVQVLECL